MGYTRCTCLLVLLVLFCHLPRESHAVTPNELLELGKKHLGEHYSEEDIHLLTGTHPDDYSGNDDHVALEHEIATARMKANRKPDPNFKHPDKLAEELKEGPKDSGLAFDFVHISLATAFDRARSEEAALHVLDYVESGLIQRHHKEMLRNSTAHHRDVPEEQYQRLFHPRENVRTGMTPLMVATRKGFKDVVKRLGRHIRLSSEALTKDPGSGLNAAHFAMKGNDSELVDLLTERVDMFLEELPNHKGLPINMAASNGHVGVVDRMMVQYKKRFSKGLDGLIKDRSGITPLITAARDRATAVAKLLVEHGLDPLRRCDVGTTAYHWARWHGNDELVEFFHARNVSIPEWDDAVEFGRTIVHYAASNNDVGLVREAAERGVNMNIVADPDHKTSNPLFTPLETAIHLGHQNNELIETLIDAKAKVFSIAKTGRSSPMLMMVKYVLVLHHKFISMNTFRKFIMFAIDMWHYEEQGFNLIDHMQFLHVSIPFSIFEFVRDAAVELGRDVASLWNRRTKGRVMYKWTTPLNMMLSGDVNNGVEWGQEDDMVLHQSNYRKQLRRIVEHHGALVDFHHDDTDWSSFTSLEVAASNMAYQEYPPQATCSLLAEYLSKEKWEWYQRNVIEPYNRALIFRECSNRRIQYLANYVNMRYLPTVMFGYGSLYGPFDVPRGQHMFPHFAEIKTYGPLEVYPPPAYIYKAENHTKMPEEGEPISKVLVQYPMFRDIHFWRFPLVGKSLKQSSFSRGHSIALYRTTHERTTWYGYWAFLGKSMIEDPYLTFCEAYLHRWDIPKNRRRHLDPKRVYPPYSGEYDKDAPDPNLPDVENLRRSHRGLWIPDDGDLDELQHRLGVVLKRGPYGLIDTIYQGMKENAHVLGEKDDDLKPISYQEFKKLEAATAFAPTAFTPPMNEYNMFSEIPEGPQEEETPWMDQDVISTRSIEKHLDSVVRACVDKIRKNGFQNPFEDHEHEIKHAPPEMSRNGETDFVMEPLITCDIDFLSGNFRARELIPLKNVEKIPLREYAERLAVKLFQDDQYQDLMTQTHGEKFASSPSYADLWRASHPSKRFKMEIEALDNHDTLKAVHDARAQRGLPPDPGGAKIEANIQPADEMINWPVLYGPSMV